MVRSPGRGVERGQGVMVVHGQRASGRHEALHRVAFGGDGGGPEGVQIIEVSEEIGRIRVGSRTVGLIPGPQLREEVSVPDSVRGEILEASAEFNPLVEHQLVPAPPPDRNNRLVDVDGQHELRSVEVVVETVVVGYQLHPSLDPDVIAEQPPPRVLLARQIAR